MRPMDRRPARLSRRLSLACAAALAASLLAPVTAGASGAGDRSVHADDAGSPHGAAVAVASTHTVTLVTGDLVKMVTFTDGRQHAGLVPDAGDPVPGQLIRRVGDDLYVVPREALPLLARRRLDPDLFNVTALIEQGYDDAQRSTLPLLVRYGGRHVEQFRRAGGLAPQGASVERVIAPLGLAVLSQSKVKAREFWADVTGQQRDRFTGGIARMWLDGRVHATLADSVPQIGAPKAWADGYDGRGVKVAVLDTGVDATHPDLAGKVAKSANFSDDRDAVDHHGHGTHVAATVAGTGRASGGSRKGVAPGAVLLNGKVLDEFGSGSESSVLAGMQWAVAQGADVVSMSLGGGPTDGTDPLSMAVNRLTKRSGALFVVAAGNDYDEQTINTPAAADAALAVGAVDKRDVLAEFSSKGPRLSDFAIKPEITAPGVDIIAARAKGTSLGDVVDPRYTSLSGTSMATPHVAGAAAILVQEHPRWAPDRLKAALVTTAKPAAGVSVYHQGVGRVDVARAHRQHVTASAGTLNMGYYSWPHEGNDQLVERRVTYRNAGRSPVRLDLSLDIRDRAGKPTPPGMVKLDADSLTVAPGGSADVTVTLDPNVGAPALYGGLLTATRRGGTTVLRTAVGFYKETEMYTLSAELVGRDGRPASGVVNLFGLSRDRFDFEFVDGSAGGTVSFRVPPGSYSLMGFIDEFPSVTLAGRPQLWVGRDTTVRMDARDGNEATVRVPDVVERRSVDIGYEREARGRGLGSFFGGPFDHVYAVPTNPVTTGRFSMITRWDLQAPETRARPRSPYVYDLRLPEHGRIPADLRYTFRYRDLARIDEAFHAHRPGQRLLEARFGFGPEGGFAFALIREVVAPFGRTDYVSANETQWMQDVQAGPFFGFDGYYSEEPRSYAPGSRTYTSWLRQVARPAVPDGFRYPGSGIPPFRQGNRFSGVMLEYVDDAGHLAYIGESDAARHRIYADGRLIAKGSHLFLDGLRVPAQRSSYRVVLDTERKARWWRYSTRTRSDWRFSSARPQTGAVRTLPMTTVRWQTHTGLLNRLPAGQRRQLGLRVQPALGASQRVERVQVHVSYNDGASWVPVPPPRRTAAGRYVVTVDHPRLGRTNGYVSLRVYAATADGATLRQSVARAYGLH